MNRLETREERDSWSGRRGRNAAVVFLALACCMGATIPATAVGPRVGSDAERIEIPEAIVVSPEISRLPRSLVNLRGSLAQPLSQGWFGIGLSCSDCVISREDSAAVWSFGEPPEIHYVDPDGPAAEAGLRRGDILIQIDGMPITSREGGRRFGAIKPGDKVRWIYERDGRKKEATLVAEAHPDRDFYVAPEVTAEVEAALADLRLQQSKILEEGELLRSKEVQKAMKDQMRAAREALERASESLQREGYLVAPKGKKGETIVWPSRRQNLRYEGRLGGSEIEVLGSGSVVVTENRDDGELLITTPEATIRIRKSK